mmetsp:Transcript_12246/g.26064  ORF Transcript_12246/g.26064 Transcript_12246/m.26064 type:complete len:231 (-) Transcript_12246:760-1452(-)
MLRRYGIDQIGNVQIDRTSDGHSFGFGYAGATSHGRAVRCRVLPSPYRRGQEGAHPIGRGRGANLHQSTIDGRPFQIGRSNRRRGVGQHHRRRLLHEGLQHDHTQQPTRKKGGRSGRLPRRTSLPRNVHPIDILRLLGRILRRVRRPTSHGMVQKRVRQAHLGRADHPGPHGLLLRRGTIGTQRGIESVSIQQHRRQCARFVLREESEISAGDAPAVREGSEQRTVQFSR